MMSIREHNYNKYSYPTSSAQMPGLVIFVLKYSLLKNFNLLLHLYTCLSILGKQAINYFENHYFFLFMAQLYNTPSNVANLASREASIGYWSPELGSE